MFLLDYVHSGVLFIHVCLWCSSPLILSLSFFLSLPLSHTHTISLSLYLTCVNLDRETLHLFSGGITFAYRTEIVVPIR